MQYHVQTTAGELRSGFPYFAYHESVSSLWKDKWRPLCAASIYPFTDAKVEDFDPIFAELIRISGDDPLILHRPDDYATPFMPAGEKLAERAEGALAEGKGNEARDLFLRSAAVYRIARFPINRSALSEVAWERGKAAYENGGRLLNPPSTPLAIPFEQADTAAGDTHAVIEANVRVPKGTRPKAGWPVVLFICGLDAYRTDHTPRTQQHVDNGFATISFEIPGTGDCPAAPGDPTSPDRLMSSVLDWVVTNADHHFDVSKIIARGISTGGYYAFRAAHTHADRLFAVVAQGGGCHHMFDAEWIRAQDQMEYPFALAEALAHKFGYRGSDKAAAVARYASEARDKFSLVEAQIVGTPTCRLLVINGMEDSIFPIEDSLLIATQGDKKDLVARGDRGHMGNPGAEEILYEWINKAVAGKP